MQRFVSQQRAATNNLSRLISYDTANLRQTFCHSIHSSVLFDPQNKGGENNMPLRRLASRR